MAEEGTKREGTELLGLPPRKRFKVMEQQRRKEVEEAPESHCSDITNVMRVSPKKLTSQGFLVLEKQKYKLQQQKLQENLAPGLPPRPVAVKRKEAAALPLPTPPAMRLKFQGEKVHSLSSSAFKSWGSKKVVKSEPAPVAPKSSKGQAQKPKYQQLETVSTPPKTWTMAKGTTCSINKAQEDVEMLNLDMFSSDDDVPVSTSTTSSLDLNVAAEVDNLADASQDAEIVTMPPPVPSPQMEDAIQHMEDTAVDLACSAPLEEVVHAPLAKTPVEAAHLEVPQVPTLDAPVEQTADRSGAEESTVADVSEALVALQTVDAASEEDVPTPPVPKTCSSPLATVAVPESHTDSEASNILNVEEDLSAAPEEKALPVPVDGTCSEGKDEDDVVTSEVKGKGAEICSAAKDEENVVTSEVEVKGAETCSAGKDEVNVVTFEVAGKRAETCCAGKDEENVVTSEVEVKGAETCSAGKDEVNVVTFEIAGKRAETCCAGKDEEYVVTSEVEGKNAETWSAGKDEEMVVTSGKGAPVEVTEDGDEQEQDGLLAELDERAEKLFKRMFEREGCDEEEDESDAHQFFFASNGVNNFNSLVEDMEVDQDSVRASIPEQKNGVGQGIDAVSLGEIVMDRPTVHVPNKPPEKEEEKPESLSRACEETICKSSKEDSDWDMEMEVPDFGLGKRSGGMTQRVKAPGRWSQEMATNEEDEEEDDAEEGACDVCRSADAKPSDPIVYCDGCDIPVHADCYGAPLSNKIPEGDWFCAQCQSKRPDSRNCCLCPRSGGVMKMTTDGSWAHLSCAVFVPEVFFRNADDMEGIDTSHVPSKRYLAKCCVCKKRGGACVDCTEIGCKSSFHVSCALKKDLAMEFRNGRSGAIVISFCQEHTAAWDEQQERKGRSKYKIVSREPQKPKVFQRSKSR